MANEPRLLNVGSESTIETKKGDSGTSESIVSTEAKERVEEQTESSNINQTNVKASVNASSKLLQVSTENQGTRYVRDENNNVGFSRSAGEKKVITNTILVNEVKRLIRELGGNPDVYTKEEINEIVKTIREGQYVKVDTTEYPTLEDFLDSEGEQGTVYLYPVGNDANNYYQYIWEVSDWVSLGTTEVDLSDYAKVDQAFNVINASDIVSNTLTQEQYNIITNGKPTLIKGTWNNSENPIILGTATYGDATRCLMTYATVNYSGLTYFDINVGTGYCNLRSNYIRFKTNGIQLVIDNGGNMNIEVAGKALPNYPSNTGTFVLKCVDGVLTWVQE